MNCKKCCGHECNKYFIYFIISCIISVSSLVLFFVYMFGDFYFKSEVEDFFVEFGLILLCIIMMCVSNCLYEKYDKYTNIVSYSYNAF